MFLEILSRLAKLRDHRIQVAAVDSHVRVVAAKRRLPDRQRPLILRLGAGQITMRLQHAAEIEQTGDCGQIGPCWDGRVTIKS
jgi:hypothetical protein